MSVKAFYVCDLPGSYHKYLFYLYGFAFGMVCVKKIYFEMDRLWTSLVCKLSLTYGRFILS